MTFVFAIGYENGTWERVFITQDTGPALDRARQRAVEEADNDREIVFVRVLDRDILA